MKINSAVLSVGLAFIVAGLLTEFGASAGIGGGYAWLIAGVIALLAGWFTSKE